MASPSSENVKARARKLGLLLLSDKTHESLAGWIAGEPIRGSWWGHPKAQDIYRVAEALGDDPDFLTVKLLDGKVTFVHRRLWPALLAVALSGEPWQLGKLSKPALSLLRRVEEEGTVRASGRVSSELESRLLVHAEQVHTESGKHEKILESWKVWTRRVAFESRLPPALDARVELEAHAGGATLPWTAKNRK